MEIVINGKQEAGNYSTVADLLSKRGLDPKQIIVELNGAILPKNDYARQLKDGDSLELVQFVAGG